MPRRKEVNAFPLVECDIIGPQSGRWMSIAISNGILIFMIMNREGKKIDSIDKLAKY